MSWGEVFKINENVNNKTAIKVQNILMTTTGTVSTFTATISSVDTSKSIIIPTTIGSPVAGNQLPATASFTFDNSTTVRCTMNTSVHNPSFSVAIVEYGNIV